jgi:predicted nucleic acid-binding protein
MIVVNINIISYRFICGEFSEQAEKVLIKDSQWAAPLLWRSDLRNVLTQYIRKEILTLEETVEIMENASALLENNEYDIASRQALELASKSSLSAYNCEFVDLAKDLNIKLVTADKRITEMFPQYSMLLQDFTIDE